MINAHETNREGMTFVEWFKAAGYGAVKPTSAMEQAWRAGEDPTEWCAELVRDAATRRRALLHGFYPRLPPGHAAIVGPAEQLRHGKAVGISWCVTVVREDGFAVGVAAFNDDKSAAEQYAAVMNVMAFLEQHEHGA